MKLGIGPRSFAMGEAQTAVGAGAFSLHTNPAGLALLDYREVGFVYNRWLEGVDLQHLLYAHPSGRLGTYGASLLRLSAGEFQGYDAGGLAVEKVSAQDWVGTVGWAKPFRLPGARLGVGATARWVRSELERTSATAFAADVGAIYSLSRPPYTVSVGAAAHNLGSGLKFDRETAGLPSATRLGLSLMRPIYGDPFTLAVDWILPSDDSERLNLAIGLEGSVKGILLPRIGFRVPNDLGAGLSFGMGLKIKMFRVDYALGLLGGFGAAHRFGLTFRWGEPQEIVREEERLDRARRHQTLGRRYLRENRMLEALEQFNKALEYDPTNPQILEDMKRAYDALH